MQSSMFLSHLSPVHPTGHVQVNELIPSCGSKKKQQWSRMERSLCAGFGLVAATKHIAILIRAAQEESVEGERESLGGEEEEEEEGREIEGGASVRVLI